MATDQPYDRTHNSLSSSDGIDSIRAANPPSRRASFDTGSTSQITEHNPPQGDSYYTIPLCIFKLLSYIHLQIFNSRPFEY